MRDNQAGVGDFFEIAEPTICPFCVFSLVFSRLHINTTKEVSGRDRL